MDAFVVRGGKQKPAAGGGGAKPRRARQATLASLAKVVVMPTSSLGFGSEDLARLKAQLDSPDATSAQLLDALRVLSSLVISTADLESSLLGRSVNRLAKDDGANAEARRMAFNLVQKWREEVARAKAVRGGGAGARPLPTPAPRAPAVLRDAGASLDAELSTYAHGAGTQRRSSGGGRSPASPPATAAERERWRAAFRSCLEQGSSSAAAARLAASLEAAAFGAAGGRYGATAETLRAALCSNASLRAALLSGWLAPAGAAALTGRALMATDFLADM